ncbi:MAG: glycoside hydrolase [Candidatus Eremiobacteraeota bacterium]|nr:glycoside hydrolase [Candidatus Eremiobacteraeota bacterium]
MNRSGLRALVALLAFALLGATPDFSQLRWRLIGPFRGGRTVSVAGVPNQRGVFYMAPTNGGVWKTNDYGRTWNPIFDGQDTGSVGAIAIAPSDPNIVYVASGEGLRRPDLSVGNGIYKSSDAGRTWTHLGLRDGQQINGLAVDPRNADRVFVAVMGHPYGPNAERGLYRSEDGGTSWKRILGKDENTGAITVVLDPKHPDVVYAALWASRNGPWHYTQTYQIPKNGGLFKSTDAGTTWTQLRTGLPDGVGRIGLSVAPSDSNRMYAVVDAPAGCGIYRSSDAGASWSKVNAEERVCGRGSDFAGITADPKNADEVYSANTTTYRSMDAGKTWTGIKGAPGGDDYHTVWIDPNDSNIILLGCDQGATLSVNGGTTWSSWYNQPTAQFYHVITDDRFPYWVFGGQQESGSAEVASRSDDGEITFRQFHPVGTEEYGYVAPDPLHPNIIYGGKATRYDERTQETQDVSPSYDRKRYRFNRTAPLIFNRVDKKTLYLGANVLFETATGGRTWKIISPDLTRAHPGMPPNLGVFSATDSRRGTHRGVIYSLSPSYMDKNLLWAGTDDGLVWITRDGGAHWRNVTPPGLTPWSKVAQIDASHFDRNTAYIAVNRFRLDDLRPYVYRTHDGGTTWRLIVEGLPKDAPANTVREDRLRRNLLFAGTERSVYVSFNDGDSWHSLQENLPSISVRDLVVHGDDVVAGTHGRSFWILDDIAPLRQITTEVADSSARLFAPATAYRIRRNQWTDTPLPPEEPAGKNPPNGAIIDYYLGADATAPVVIAVYDRTGRMVRKWSSSDRPQPIDPEITVPTYWVRPSQIPAATRGAHRFVWDLRYADPLAESHSYPISAIYSDTPRAPAGVIALPGTYTVKLSANGRSYSAPLRIVMDPRITTPASGLREQYEMATRIVADMNRTYESMISAKDRHDAAAAGRWADLNGNFAQLLEVVEGSDYAPTRAARDAFRTLELQLAAGK